MAGTTPGSESGGMTIGLGWLFSPMASGLGFFRLVRPKAERAVAGFGFRERRRDDALVIGRFVAGGVGVARVAGQRHRLAAAAAPVDLAPLARTAGLAHPVRAAEGREGGVQAPDVGERMIAHVPEFEARN